MSRSSKKLNVMTKDCDDFNDLMDISDSEEFTHQFLSQFDSIEWKTIETLIDNGYRNREELMAFDLKEDLPLLPNVTMAQKSLLRKALQLLMSDEELEKRVNDIKGDNVVEESKVKRKRSSAQTPIATKRSRYDSVMSDKRETPSMSQLARDLEVSTSLRKTLAKFAKTIHPTNLTNSYVEDVDVSDEDDNEEEEEEVVKLSQQRFSSGGLHTRYGFNKTTIKSEPIDIERRRSVRNSLVSPTTTPKAKSTKPVNNIPTPTEIELREHLEKQKSMGKTRRARK